MRIQLTVGALLNIKEVQKADFDQEYFFQFHYGLEPVILKNQIPEFPEVKFFLGFWQYQNFGLAKKKKGKTLLKS